MIKDSYLKQELNELLLPDMRDNKQDLFVNIFGDEGTGKSIFALNLAKFVDPTFNAQTLPYRLAQTVNDFGRVAPNLKQFQAGIWDEAHRLKKRGAGSSSVNSDILTYFQDIREGKKIIILCYPRFKEIDYIAVERSKLFFETVRGGNSGFMVRAWTKKQMRLKLRELNLPSPKTRAELWAGTPQIPKRVFTCDLEGIEEEFAAYQNLKNQSIKNTDETLRDKYGYWSVLKISGEVWAKLQEIKIDRSVQTIRLIVAGIAQDMIDANFPIQFDGSEYKIYDEAVKDEIVNRTIDNFKIKLSKYIMVDVSERHQNERNNTRILEKPIIA